MKDRIKKRISIDTIHRDEAFNCRGEITAMDVADLARDIEARGLIQPIAVEEYSPEMQEKTGYKWRLLAGFCRTMAHVVLGQATIEAIIQPHMSEAEAVFFNIAENVQRTDLTIVQEARAIDKLRKLGIPEHDTAERLGKSRGWVQVRFMLLQLPEEVITEVEAGFITQTQIRELFTIFRKTGVEGVFEATRELKDAKINGRKPKQINPDKLDPDVKRGRSRGEIQDMLMYVVDTTGVGTHTRALAWASGEISDNEFYQDLNSLCIDIGRVFRKPEQRV